MLTTIPIDKEYFWEACVQALDKRRLSNLWAMDGSIVIEIR
jgi:hypothetical protein